MPRKTTRKPQVVAKASSEWAWVYCVRRKPFQELRAGAGTSMAKWEPSASITFYKSCLVAHLPWYWMVWYPSPALKMAHSGLQDLKCCRFTSPRRWVMLHRHLTHDPFKVCRFTTHITRWLAHFSFLKRGKSLRLCWYDLNYNYV